MKKLLIIGLFLGCTSPLLAMEESSSEEDCTVLATSFLRLGIRESSNASIIVAVKNGADVNTTFEFTLPCKDSMQEPKKITRWTPLHYAAFQGDIELTKLFLAKGAKVNAVDSEDKNPIDYCRPNKKLAQFIAGETKGKAHPKTIRSSTEVFELIKNAPNKAD